jgi:hypothetical protein
VDRDLANGLPVVDVCRKHGTGDRTSYRYCALDGLRMPARVLLQIAAGR